MSVGGSSAEVGHGVLLRTSESFAHVAAGLVGPCLNFRHTAGILRAYMGM